MFIIVLDSLKGIKYYLFMSQSTISTFQLFQMFPDAETARVYLEARLWPNGVVCPTCKGQERITTPQGWLLSLQCVQAGLHHPHGNHL
jgi:hypothetical protein